MIMEETFKNKFTLVEKDMYKIVKVEFMFLFIQKNYHLIM